MNPHDSRTERQRWKTTALSALCAVLLGGVTLLSPLQAATVQASEERIVNKPDGSPLFALHFFDLGERYEDYEDPDVPGYSPWQLSGAQKDAVTRAAALWAEVLGPDSRNSAPIPITIGTYLVQNADASSEPNGAPGAGYTLLHAVGAFRDEASVDDLRQRLEGRGLRTRMERSGKLYLVLVLLRGTDERAAEIPRIMEELRLGKPMLRSRKPVLR